MKIIKRNNTEQDFDRQRIVNAVNKAGGNDTISNIIADKIEELLLHNKLNNTVKDIEKKVVDLLIDTNNKGIAISYEGYRAIQEYKRNMELRSEFNDILTKPNRENANKNSYLISSKKGHILDAFIQNEMLTHILPKKLAEAHIDNKIKFHDISDRYFGGINCCLFDMKTVIENNPIINGLKYDDADSVEAYLGILSDVLLEASSQQYGGFTINEIDHVLEDVLEKSYNKSIEYYKNILKDKVDENTIKELAYKFIERAFKKRWNGIETRLNSISNSNMQVPFETISLGNRTTKWARFVTKTILETRLKGCGKLNQTAIFPKIVFFYREEIHGKGKVNEDLYNLAILCRSKRNYPDMLSLDEGLCGKYWKKYHIAVAPMGCVDGNETITYTYKDKEYKNISFKDMWNNMSNEFDVKEQLLEGNYYIDLKNVKIFDSKNGYVKCHRIIKNMDKGDWIEIVLLDGHKLIATLDHPLPVEGKGRTYIRDLSINDKLYTIKDGNIIPVGIQKIRLLGYRDEYSYDVTTESDYFDVSGIYSHNCRAYLSPYINEKGEVVFNGRANCGAITINTVRPALMYKDTKDKESYFKELKKYFDLATEGHLWQYNRMKNIKASSNPLFFCMGGCHIKLNPEDTIEKAIKTFTWSYGYIGLNEASILMTGKEIHEDNSFAIEVLEHLNKWKQEAIDEYGLLFAIYGSPAEKYSETCRDKEYERFGEIPRITDKKYFMNSFHCNVTAKIDPFYKMECEKPMFDLSNGGHIFYSEYPINHNIEAIDQVTKHAMKMGLYEGVNFDSAICENCGKEILDYDKNNPVCTHCGSHKIIVTDRVCGYLSYFVIDGDTRANEGKVQEDLQREVHYGREVERGIHDFEILNGEGLRVSVWFTGCPHQCEDCHNKFLWKHDEKIKLNQNKIIELCKIRKKLSILGGEPLAEYNRDELLELLEKVKEEVPDCSIY